MVERLQGGGVGILKLCRNEAYGTVDKLFICFLSERYQENKHPSNRRNDLFRMYKLCKGKISLYVLHDLLISTIQDLVSLFLP